MKSIIFSLVFVFAIYTAEARGFGATVAKRDVLAQADLLAKLAGLLGKSGGIIAELEKAGKPLLAAGIQKVEDILKGLEEKVKNANPHTELGKLALKGLDELILLAEHKLEDEIKKLEGTTTLAKRDVLAQADLLAKLAGLLGKSGGIIAELEKAGKPLLAAGIQKVEDILKGLEEKVKNANPHTELGKLALKGLDELILLAEHKLEDEIKKLEGTTTLAKRDAQADLLLKLASLLGKSGGVVAELKAAGKPLLAAGVQKIEDELNKLVEKVKKENPHTVLGKLALKGLEELVSLAEKELEKEVAKITGAATLAKRDAQADLLLKLASLLGKSGGIIGELEKAGKPLLAAGIRKVEDLLKNLEAKVQKENPHTLLGKLALKGLDELILLAEHELEKEIAKLEGSGYMTKRDVLAQADLLAKLAGLLGKSGGIIAELEKAGKPLLAAGIQKVEDILKGLEEKVKNANPHTELGKLALKGLDELILLAEHKLEDEIKKLEGTTTLAKRDVLAQADLLAKLAGLLGKSGGIIAELEKAGKPLLAAGIQKVEDILKGLEEKVKNANPHTELGKLALKGLDELILLAEHKLEDEIKKLEGTTTLAKRDAQADLLLKLASLLGKSGGIIGELEKAGKPLLAAGIRKVEDLLKNLEAKVQKENPHTLLGKLALKGLDELILLAEHELEKEIAKLEGAFALAKRDAQADLLGKLAGILGKSGGIIAELEKAGKPLLAAGIRKVEDLLKGLEEKVKNENPHSLLGKLALEGLDQLIIFAEHELEKEIAKLEGSF